MNINVSMPTKHQMAVLGSHAVVAAGGAIGALAFFGGLDHAQVQEATQDVNRIASDVADLIGAVGSLAALAMAAYSTIKSGPLGSFLRASQAIAASPKLMDQVRAAPLDQKASVVAITDNLPEVAGVATVNTRGGQALATAVTSSTVQVAKA